MALDCRWQSVNSAFYKLQKIVSGYGFEKAASQGIRQYKGYMTSAYLFILQSGRCQLLGAEGAIKREVKALKYIQKYMGAAFIAPAEAICRCGY